jgi:hypothetical protein
MYQFGPYGPMHSTAATFAFRKELLKQTRFDEVSCVAEEEKFLKDYTIPFVQLDPKKSIVVFSHNHNSFDKKELLQQMPNPHIHETDVLPQDIVKEKEILQFFMNDIDNLLESYEPGNIKNKPDVIKQLSVIREQREKMMKEHIEQQAKYNDTMQKIQMLQSPNDAQNKINNLSQMVQELTLENSQLKDKINYLENKITEIIKKISKN